MSANNGPNDGAMVVAEETETGTTTELTTMTGKAEAEVVEEVMEMGMVAVITDGVMEIGEMEETTGEITEQVMMVAETAETVEMVTMVAATRVVIMEGITVTTKIGTGGGRSGGGGTTGVMARAMEEPTESAPCRGGLGGTTGNNSCRLRFGAEPNAGSNAVGLALAECLAKRRGTQGERDIRYTHKRAVVFEWMTSRRTRPRRRSGSGCKPISSYARARTTPVSELAAEVTVEGSCYNPNEEIKKMGGLQVLVPKDKSLTRQHLDKHLEKQMVLGVNVVYSTFYTFESLCIYSRRDTVALPGFSSYFTRRAVEHWRWAASLCWFLGRRGGNVVLREIPPPPAVFHNPEKGDALYMMEYALALEKVEYEKMLELFRAAEKSSDGGVMNFLQTELLVPSVTAIKRCADYVSQLRLIGKTAGLFTFDRMLLREMEEEGVGIGEVIEQQVTRQTRSEATGGLSRKRRRQGNAESAG
ncbi:hypothetical protein CBR_g1080 [Chara braunii]|uniref:Ferritin n=1 Tax=Chara braunii TaxID=69332 RepID=A0A388KD55_CHABU|nr:hypothetical protein CBR_g1080 [Chara braunii]|eukprot:GBG67961.1 hypothetical protein CBR_g1080 [Chara braunii]